VTVNASALGAVPVREPGYEAFLATLTTSTVVAAIGTPTVEPSDVRAGHPAALNLADCLSYAVARLANEPLLFVGDDFAATDLNTT
jgi:uncharacterized protein with PIN domain